MNIRTETAGTTAVLHFAGAADVSTVANIRDALTQAMQSSGAQVVCNLGDMDFVCSDVLGAFISAEQEARARGGFLRLVHPQRRIAEILTTTQLNRLFSIYESVDSAVAGDTPSLDKH